MPSNPQRTYTDGGWRGWGHWFGTGNQHTKEFLPFDEALILAHSLGLDGRNGQKAWSTWGKGGTRPPNVPCHPTTTYKNEGWQGWGHWMGTGSTQQRVAATPPVAPVTSAQLAGRKRKR